MNNGIFLIWFIIIMISVVKRFASRSNAKLAAESMQAKPVTPDPVSAQPKRPIRVPDTEKRAPGRGRVLKPFVSDASCETQYGHVHPERTGSAMRFGGRPDLEPGYMYLNGVKVLIKEADRLEFLR